jgi:hypothetical protein
VIEVKYGDFPGETGWILRDSAGTLVGGQPTGSFSTESGALSKTAYIDEGSYSYEITDMHGDGICCQHCAGEFEIAVNGELVAISSSGEFRDVVWESFEVIRRSAGPTVDYRLDVAYDDYPYEAKWSLFHDLCCCCRFLLALICRRSLSAGSWRRVPACDP